MARLSHRCLRGFRTAPRAAVAPSPRHEPEHWLLLLAAVGTAWREKGRPWRWEACCSTCAWSEGYKGTASDLESRDTRSSRTVRSNYYQSSSAKLDLTKVAEAGMWLLMFMNSTLITHLWMRAGLPKPSWQPACDILLQNVQRKVALRLHTPDLGWATWTSCCLFCSGASASLLREKRHMTNSNKHMQVHSLA